jgi:hypothetical protein
MSTGTQLLTLPGIMPHPSLGSCSQVLGLLDPAFQSLLMGANTMPCLLHEITNGGKTKMQRLFTPQCRSEMAIYLWFTYHCVISNSEIIHCPTQDVEC